jgi:cytochrome c oxidase subunit 2
MDLLTKLLFLPEQASTFAPHVDMLHLFVIALTVIMSVGVGGTALYFFYRFRRREDRQVTEYLVPSVRTEVLFVTLPFIFFVLWAVMGFRDFVWMQTPPKDAMDVYVKGKQWMWKFAYPEGPNGVNVLHVPSNRPVRLLMTSSDVIHSFYIPAFRIKQDVLPGRYTTTWFEATKPGTYDIYCTEYCGLSHSKMLAKIVVLSPEEFETWVKEQRVGDKQNRQDGVADATLVPPEASLAVQGQKLVGTTGCLKCHTVDGTPHIGPTFLGLYGREERLQGGESVLVDEGYITQSMMVPGEKIVQGYANIMPTYQGKLHGMESAAIVEYIKSLRTRDVVNTASKGPAYEPVRQ